MQAVKRPTKTIGKSFFRNAVILPANKTLKPSNTMRGLNIHKPQVQDLLGHLNPKIKPTMRKIIPKKV